MGDRLATSNSHRDEADDAVLLDLLLKWVPDEATLARILVRNPEKLYGFS
jgi:predicted TIM-barrel fold metal-dependent hydrolase